jgi:hypothetical protein
LKSPRITQGLETRGRRESSSARKAGEWQWSEGAYTFVTVKSQSEMVEEREVVSEKCRVMELVMVQRL